MRVKMSKSMQAFTPALLCYRYLMVIFTYVPVTVIKIEARKKCFFSLAFLFTAHLKTTWRLDIFLQAINTR